MYKNKHNSSLVCFLSCLYYLAMNLTSLNLNCANAIFKNTIAPRKMKYHNNFHFIVY